MATRLWANLATLANATVGVGAIAYVLAGNKLWAMLLIIAGIGFDGLDGFFHRRSGLPPNLFGRIADSAADAITFGLAPAALLIVHTDRIALWQPWTAGTIVAGAAVAALAIGRLVWFTARAHHLPHFVGVPTPQNAIGLVVVLLLFDTPAFLGTRPEVVVGLALVLAATMVVPVPFPKIRRGARLRLPMTVTGIALPVALVPLQFRPGPGSLLYEAAFAATLVAAAGAAAYYLAGPATVPPPAAAEGSGAPR
ncbi:MAG TPA: CDP-alcohol phosphatidyltransferase family protein [Thermoplasmata archaeon]|nr:CDP-alcohol phosphatidyltransferase family protein [Thermoplasmata archaeon]